jgi:O-antigen ligase
MVALWAGTTRARIHVPYAVPVAGLAVAGLIAAMAGIAPFAGVGAVMQEVFLLAWCAAVTTICRTPEALRFVVRTWCLSATAWAVVLILTVASGQTQVPGGRGGYGDRARLWFDHPNLAGNYFMLALFVVLATRYPRPPVARAFAVVALLAAMLLAGSNTALLCLPVGGLIIVFLRVRSRSGAAPAIAVVLCLVLAGGATWSLVGKATLENVQQTDSSLLRYSVARTSRSAAGRESLFSSSYQLFRESNFIGIGPSSTSRALEESGSSLVKEAHNDYLGTLVERGPLGIVSLLVLMGAVVVRVISAQRLPPAWASVVPNPAALAAAAGAFTVTALTHEVLHYRHFWTFLALLAALHLAQEDQPARPAGTRSSEEFAPQWIDGS